MDTVKTKTETEKLFADLGKPSLHALSYALRHPDTWPEGFVWNYSKCDQCAMGLAHALWNKIPETTPYDAASIMARSFAMPFETASSIFLGEVRDRAADWVPMKEYTVTEGKLWWKTTEVRSRGDLKTVTPEMVADQIDAYLANAE